VLHDLGDYYFIDDTIRITTPAPFYTPMIRGSVDTKELLLNDTAAQVLAVTSSTTIHHQLNHSQVILAAPPCNPHYEHRPISHLVPSPST